MTSRPVAATPPTPAAEGPGRRRAVGLRRLLARIHGGSVLLGAALVVLAVALALLAPLLPLHPPDLVNTPNRLRPVLTAGHLLGTDELGRDMLSRLIWGGRVTLVAGFVSAAAAMLVGSLLGLFAGYYGGWVDEALMRITDILMAFPFILLGIAIVAGLGPGLGNAMIAVTIAGFPTYSRIVRGSVLSVRQLGYVESAIATGASTPRLMVRHIIPNVISLVVVTLSLDIGNKIIATASLSFLGFGTQPPTADWGSMLATGREFITTAPGAVVIPGLAILLVVFGFNLVGDAVRDVLDPRVWRD